MSRAVVLAARQIPEKLYFKIGEVSKIVGVKPYVLRYWETEFKEIGPVKSRSNQRLYRRKDVQALIAIKQLLYKDGFTISGARKKVRDLLREGENTQTKTKKPSTKKGPVQTSLIAEAEEAASSSHKGSHKKLLKKIRAELIELRDLMNIGA